MANCECVAPINHSQFTIRYSLLYFSPVLPFTLSDAVKDTACVAFLQWALPKLGMRWPGFRKVRGQVCKRVGRRVRALGLDDVAAYRAYLETHPAEWNVLDTLCRITISRFYRDRGVFDRLRETLLPALARHATEHGRTTLRAWSAGCASGEEAYTLALLWRHVLQPSFPRASLSITATDAGAHMLERARRGCYPKASLKELPSAWIDAAFSRSDNEYCIHPAYRAGIDWREQDLRHAMPDGPFNLILCRYLVFTYFDEPLQHACLARMAERLCPHGLLVLGKHEALPGEAIGFTALDEHNRIYQRVEV